MTRKKNQETAAAAPAGEPKRITPADIQQKEFRLALRGYNERDVDVFLDELTEEVARLYGENKRLREELEARATLPESTRAAVEADAIVRRARDEAAAILAQARAQAGPARPAGEIGESATVTAGSRAALGRLVARERQFLQSLATLIQEHAKAVKEDLGANRTPPEAPAGAGGRAAAPPRPGEATAGAVSEAGRGWGSEAGTTREGGVARPRPAEASWAAATGRPEDATVAWGAEQMSELVSAGPDTEASKHSALMDQPEGDAARVEGSDENAGADREVGPGEGSPAAEGVDPTDPAASSEGPDRTNAMDRPAPPDDTREAGSAQEGEEKSSLRSWPDPQDPDTVDEDEESDRSVRELFWGED